MAGPAAIGTASGGTANLNGPGATITSLGNASVNLGNAHGPDRLQRQPHRGNDRRTGQPESCRARHVDPGRADELFGRHDDLRRHAADRQRRDRRRHPRRRGRQLGAGLRPRRHLHVLRATSAAPARSSNRAAASSSLPAATATAGPRPSPPARCGLPTSAALPPTSPLSVASGATIDLNGVNVTASAIGGSGVVALGTATLTLSDTTTTLLSAQVVGAGSLIKTGPGTLVLTASEGYTRRDDDFRPGPCRSATAWPAAACWAICWTTANWSSTARGPRRSADRSRAAARCRRSAWGCSRWRPATATAAARRSAPARCNSAAAGAYPAATPLDRGRGGHVQSQRLRLHRLRHRRQRQRGPGQYHA